MFSSYIENPDNTHFEGQDPDEKILLLLRAHPITNLTWIIPALLLFFLPFYLPAIINFLGLDFPQLPTSFLVIYLIVNYMLTLVIVFEGFLNWFYNVYLVTTKNIIDVDFYSLIFRSIEMAPLANIEEARSEMGGVIKSIFNFGDIFVQTAGSQQDIDFHSVPRPNLVADFILDRAHSANSP